MSYLGSASIMSRSVEEGGKGGGQGVSCLPMKYVSFVNSKSVGPGWLVTFGLWVSLRDRQLWVWVPALRGLAAGQRGVGGGG